MPKGVGKSRKTRAGFVLRRLLRSALILLAVSAVAFLFTLLMPGNHFEVTLSGSRVSPERIAQLSQRYGFDRPIFQQYLSWLSGAVRLDFGLSLSYGKPVCAVIADFLPPTLLLGCIAFVLELILGTALGVFAASRPGGLRDTGVSAVTLALICIPTFLLCLTAQVFFAVKLQIFPLSSLHTPGESGVADFLWHITLPCLILAVTEAARLSRYVRDALRRALAGDYILLARMKGLTRRQTLLRHALPCASIPLITYLGLSLPYLFAGSLIVENVFAIRGLGMASYQAVLQRDYPLIMGITMLVAAAAVLGSLLADLAYGFVDVRIRGGDGSLER